MIDVIVREKGIENLTPLELAIYIFKNGIDDAIIKVKDQEVVKITKEKMDRFNEDEELRLAAYNRELNIMAHEGEKQEARQEGMLEMIKNQAFEFFHKSFPNEDDSFLNNLKTEQYKMISNMLFERKSLNNIKSYIKENQ